MTLLDSVLVRGRRGQAKEITVAGNMGNDAMALNMSDNEISTMIHQKGRNACREVRPFDKFFLQIFYQKGHMHIVTKIPEKIVV